MAPIDHLDIDGACPGCGLRAPEGWHGAVEPDRPIRASAACWGLHAELAGFELLHQARLGRLHQLTVDAYGAQHAGPPTGQRRVAYSLAGLALAIERGWSGAEVRDLHARMGPVQPSWPSLPPPAEPAPVTVADVVAAGAWADSPRGHAEVVERWARAVWASWSDHRDVILAWADGLVATTGSLTTRQPRPMRARG